jgi:two-component system, OmpR family, sensor kinase
MGRLFWKFFLFFFIAQLTTALAVGVFIQFNANDRANKARVDLSPLSQSFVEAAQSTLQFGGLTGLKQLLQRWETQELKHRVFVVDSRHRDLLDRTVAPALIEKAVQSQSRGVNESVASVKMDGETYLIFVASTIARGSRVVRPLPSDELSLLPPPKPPIFNPLFRTIATFPIKALMIAATASALFAAILAWYFSKPISRLRYAFKRAAEGDLQFSVASQMNTRNDELSDLGLHFDEMIKRLSALMQGQSRLLHHVSHELRSPLARMQMALGLATQTPEKAESALERIALEAERMDKLIGELLELSRFESGMVALNKERFSFNALLDSIVEDANFEAADKNIQIVSEITEPITVEGQLDLLSRAVENVVRNAIKYAPNDSIVGIKTVINNQQLELSITDQGAGVLATELADIFKPFVRGNSGSQVVGHGVGLAITKQVVEAHGGQVVAQNLKPNGFVVTIMLPNNSYSISPDR